MKKVVVRPMDGPELEDGVGRLRIRAFPYFPETRDTGFYADVYRWFEGHPLADEVHRWVALDGDKVVGHLAATPQYYRVDGQRVVAHTPGDYMVDEGYGFQALSLMRNFFRTTQNCVVCDMVPAVIEIETKLGAKVAGEMDYAAKLLNVSRLPMPPVPAPIRRALNLPDSFAPSRGFTDRPGVETEDAEEYVAPPAPRPRAPLPGPLKSLLNRGLGAIDEALDKNFGGDLRAEVLDGFDESFDDLFERVATVVPCVAEKDSAFLRWRYGPGSPQAPVTVLGVRSGGRLLGYAVLRSASKGQDGYVLDLVALPGRRDVTRALLRGTVHHFRKTGAQIIRYRYLDSPTSARSGDLTRLGFFSRKGRRNNLLVKFKDADQHRMALDLTNWSYNIGDGEASFWLR
jgi:hypothetical protein